MHTGRGHPLIQSHGRIQQHYQLTHARTHDRVATGGKRASLAPPSPSASRAGKSRRVSDGDLGTRSSGLGMLQDDSALAQTVDTTERLCITVDGNGRRKSDFIRLGVEMLGSRNSVWPH